MCAGLSVGSVFCVLCYLEPVPITFNKQMCWTRVHKYKLHFQQFAFVCSTFTRSTVHTIHSAHNILRHFQALIAYAITWIENQLKTWWIPMTDDGTSNNHKHEYHFALIVLTTLIAFTFNETVLTVNPFG